MQWRWPTSPTLQCWSSLVMIVLECYPRWYLECEYLLCIMYIHICVYLYIHDLHLYIGMHACGHTHTHMHTHTCTHTNTHTHTHTHTHAHTQTHTHICTYTCTHTNTHTLYNTHMHTHPKTSYTCVCSIVITINILWNSFMLSLSLQEVDSAKNGMAHFSTG